MSMMEYTPESEITGRIKAVQREIGKTDLDGLLVIHHTNLFYYSGTSQKSHLFIPASGPPLLLVRKSYDRALKESPIGRILPLDSLKEIPGLINENCGTDLSSIGLELDVIPYNTYEFYAGKIFPDVSLVDASPIFKRMRLIKSEYEIDRIRNACHILDAAFAKVKDFLREGMAEVELAALFEAQLRKNGYSGVCKMRAFNQDFMYGNIVSGGNAVRSSYFDGPINGAGVTPANNPHGAGWKKINRDESIYIDYTCVINGYTADAERIFVMGRLDEALFRAHKVALAIQDEIVRFIRPGVSGAAVWNLAERIAAEEGLGRHFMGMDADRVAFVGHGVGLELDEWPVFAPGVDLQLKEGMTFALEPKFVFEQGAVGIENTFVVQKQGCENLNRFDEEIQYL